MGDVAEETLQFQLCLTDPRAISIVENIPEDQRNSVIEKYIILGDMVVSHASISTNKETIENFFEPLRQDIERMREGINRIVPTIATPSLKGDMTVGAVYESLKDHFMDDVFEDVSKIGKFSDILAKVDKKVPVLIELKDYKNPVPSAEIDKFWRDMEVHNVNYGVFISMRTDITGCSSCISMQKKMNRTAIFVVNSDLNWKGHLFSFYVVKKIVEFEGTKPKGVSLTKYTKRLTKIQRLVGDIKGLTDDIEEVNKTAEDLKSLSNTRIQKIVSTINTYKIHLNEKIDQILEEGEESEES